METKKKLTLKNLREMADSLYKQGKITVCSRNVVYDRINLNTSDYVLDICHKLLKGSEEKTDKDKIELTLDELRRQSMLVRYFMNYPTDMNVVVSDPFTCIMTTNRNKSYREYSFLNLINKIVLGFKKMLKNSSFELRVVTKVVGEFSTFYIHSGQKIIVDSNDVDRVARQYISSTKFEIDEKIVDECEWFIEGVQCCLGIYKPFTGSTYVKTPKDLMHMKCIVNVKNSDNKCFLWATLSCLHPVDKNGDRVACYKKYENEINIDGVNFPPATIDEIDKIEELNPGLKFNVYEYDEKDDEQPVRIIRKCKTFDYKKDRAVWLLLLENKHYVYIKNYNSLISLNFKLNNLIYNDI
jgi:hypothetical protein